MDGFSLKLMFKNLLKIRGEISSLIKIW